MTLTGKFQNSSKCRPAPTSNYSVGSKEEVAVASISHEQQHQQQQQPEPACCSQAGRLLQVRDQTTSGRTGNQGGQKLDILGEPPGVAQQQSAIDEQHRILNVVSGDSDDLDDGDSDNDTEPFDYEPVLTKILNEKKLALSYSPEVLQFLGSQQTASQAPPNGRPSEHRHLSNNLHLQDQQRQQPDPLSPALPPGHHLHLHQNQSPHQASREDQRTKRNQHKHEHQLEVELEENSNI